MITHATQHFTDTQERSPLELILAATVEMDNDISKYQTIEELVKLAHQTYVDENYDLHYAINKRVEKRGVKYFWYDYSHVYFKKDSPELARICGDDYYQTLLEMPKFIVSAAYFCGDRCRAVRIAFDDLFPYTDPYVIKRAETEERDFLTLTTKYGGQHFEILETVSKKELKIRRYHVGSDIKNDSVYRSNPHGKVIIVRKRRDGNYGRGKNIYVPSETKLTITLDDLLK